MMANNSSVFTVSEKVPIIEMCVGMEIGLYIWGIATLILCVVGIPASFAILWEMYKAFRDRAPVTSVSLFLLNLSIMDAILFFCQPITVVSVFKFRIRLIESFTSAAYNLSLCGRPLMMACICLDYYVAVVHPIFYRRMKSETPRAVGVAAVWMLTFISGGIYFHYPLLYFSFYSTMYYIIAMVVIGFCDAFILQALVVPAKDRNGVHPQKKKAIHIIRNSLVMVAISYLPPTVLFIFGLFLMSDRRQFICTIGIPASLTGTSGLGVVSERNGKFELEL